jgi:hypothetical protein
MKKVNKGDQVRITNNSILNDAMGLSEATGTVFLVRVDGSGFSFQCQETGAIETCDLDDGQIEVNGLIGMWVDWDALDSK